MKKKDKQTGFFSRMRGKKEEGDASPDDAPSPPDAAAAAKEDPAAAPAPAPAPEIATVTGGAADGERLSKRIMVLDDDAVLIRLMKYLLKSIAEEAQFYSDIPEALIAVQSQEFDLIITDYQLPSGKAVDFIQNYRKLNPDVPVLVISGFMSLDTVLEISKLGVAGIYTKPLDIKGFSAKVKELLSERSGRVDAGGGTAAPEAQAEAIYNAQSRYLQGSSPAYNDLMQQIEKFKDFTGTMLVLGPVGSEFEQVVRELVAKSKYSDARPIFIRASELRPAILLSALKSARHFGKNMVTFALLDGHVLSERGQAALTTLLKREGVYAEFADKFRLLFCSEEDLSAKVEAKQFSEFLYFSVSLAELQIAPLDSRSEDVPFICKQVLGFVRERNPHVTVKRIDPEVVSAFKKRTWPGNFRELEERLEWVILNCPGESVDLKNVEESMRHITRTPWGPDESAPSAAGDGGGDDGDGEDGDDKGVEDYKEFFS